MGLTSALNTSLNGLTLNEVSIDVLGNNIANAGTNGFKSSEVLFTSQLSRTLSVGSRPTATNGGTNPTQVGLGATTSAIVKDFSQGSVTNSTSPSDLAILGDGFFVVSGSDGEVYTRNGNFSLNSANLLVDAQGLRVQGYGVDDDFNLISTQLTDLEIPLGDLNVAQQTHNVEINGALLPTGEIATQGTLASTTPLTDAGNGGAAIVGTTLLSDVQDGGSNLFTVGETLSYSTRKGGRSTATTTLDITATTTVNEMIAMMDDAIGIHSSIGVPGTPGVTLTAAGEIMIEGNYGTVNDLNLAVGDFISDGSAIPLAFNKTQNAEGESTVTDFIVFDSLGQPVEIQLSAVMESVTSTSTTFRYFIESDDDSDTDTVVSSGTITFDSSGNVINGQESNFSIDRDNTAAVSPMIISIDFSNISGISSETAGSSISLNSQDGSDPGSLTSFVIDETGVVNGVFDNGIIRTLGQVALARFSNPQGLLEAGSGTFNEGVSSGPPFVATPGNFGAGNIQAGAIELSNTDIGQNLVDLIVASTNYRGNARVISSVQQLVDELLILGR